MCHGSSWWSWRGLVWPARPYFCDKLQREVGTSRPDKGRTECEGLSCVAAQCTYVQNVVIHSVCLRTIAIHTHTCLALTTYVYMGNCFPFPSLSTLTSHPPLPSPPRLSSSVLPSSGWLTPRPLPSASPTSWQCPRSEVPSTSTTWWMPTSAATRHYPSR